MTVTFLVKVSRLLKTLQAEVQLCRKDFCFFAEKNWKKLSQFRCLFRLADFIEKRLVLGHHMVPNTPIFNFLGSLYFWVTHTNLDLKIAYFRISKIYFDRNISGKLVSYTLIVNFLRKKKKPFLHIKWVSAI